MKTTKVLIILLIPFLLELVNACCDCEDSQILYFTHENLSLSLIDNSSNNCVITQADTISKNAFGIHLTFDLIQQTAINWNTDLSFIQKTYAFDCFCPPENVFKARDSIVKIEIQTLNDFDSLHPANSYITEYFTVYDSYTFSSIETYLNKEQLTYMESFDISKISIHLLLMHPPTQALQKFKTTITLSDGRILSKESKNIYLL